MSAAVGTAGGALLSGLLLSFFYQSLLHLYCHFSVSPGNITGTCRDSGRHTRSNDIYVGELLKKTLVVEAEGVLF